MISSRRLIVNSLLHNNSLLLINEKATKWSWGKTE